jgi:long-chain acyl-CoA synthetase
MLMAKNIYPTPVENTYLKSSKIEQIFLIGDKREYVTAILIPSKEVLQETFHLNEEFFQEKDSFIRDQKILDWLNEDIRKYSTELAKFERMKSFLVKRNPFSIEEGEITPTMKAKRKVIENKYSEDISEMYLAGYGGGLNKNQEQRTKNQEPRAKTIQYSIEKLCLFWLCFPKDNLTLT